MNNKIKNTKGRIHNLSRLYCRNLVIKWPVLLAGLLVFITNLFAASGLENSGIDYGTLSANSSNYIKLEKLDYHLREEVIIDISLNTSSFKSLIIFENTTYSYNNLSNIAFTPKNTGNYSILLDINSTIIESLNFTVNSDDIALFTDKNEYLLGQTVLIYSNNINKNYTVSIKSSSGVYNLVGLLDSPIEFVPSTIGAYQIIAENNLDKLNSTTNFTVKAAEKSEGKVSIYTDKKTYFIDEFVNIYLNFTKKDSYIFYITSESNFYQFLGYLDDKLTFKPESTGDYIAKIEEADKVLASYSFEVIEKTEEKMLSPFYLSDELFYAGNRITIFVNMNLPSLKILFDHESYEFFNVTRNITFIPNKAGSYTVEAIIENKTFSETFAVIKKEEEYEHSFGLDQDVIIDFDLKPVVENKRTILNIIFGTSPIDKLVFYVENHSIDNNFNLSVEQLSKEYFRVRIKNNPLIDPNIYKLIAEITINEEVINETKILKWGYLETKEPLNETPGEIEINETYDRELEIIRQYANYSFNIDEDAAVEVDFTDKIEVQRDILDIALKKSKLGQLTAYVEGHEFDDNFNLSVEHIELDKFLITVKKNKNIEADVYKLIVIGEYQDQTIIEKAIFNWGLFNSTIFIERFNLLKNKTADIIIPIVNETPIINVTNKTIIENITEIINETLLNETIIINETEINETIENITTINEAIVERNITNISIKKEVKTIKLNKPYFDFKDSNNRKIELEFRILDEAKEEFKSLAVEEGQENITLNRTYDVEVLLKNHAIKRIIFFDLNLSEKLELGIDSIPNVSAPRALMQKKVYALDASRLSFSNMTVTLSANASKLYKCKDWNFTAQTCFGSWEKIQDLEIGKEYNLTLTNNDPAFIEAEVSNESITNITIYREQSNRANTGEVINVLFAINNNGDYIGNLNITDHIPDGWELQSYPYNSIINDTSITIPISGVNENSIKIINYTIVPEEEGLFTFSAVSSYLNGNNTIIRIKNDPYVVEVNDSEAAFEISAEVSINQNNFGRMLSDSIEYDVNFKIKNSDKKSVTKFDTFFRWILDNSWEISLDNIDNGCRNKKIMQKQDKKIIECSWPIFRKNEIKYLKITLKNNNADFEELTRVNITYDPPAAIALTERKDNPEIGVSINITPFYEDLIVRFKHNSSDFETIELEGDINYSIDKHFSKGNEGVTFIIHNYTNQPFTLNIGDKEIIPFGRSSAFFEFSKEEKRPMLPMLITGMAVYAVKDTAKDIISAIRSGFLKIAEFIIGIIKNIGSTITGLVVKTAEIPAEETPVEIPEEQPSIEPQPEESQADKPADQDVIQEQDHAPPQAEKPKETPRKEVRRGGGGPSVDRTIITPPRRLLSKEVWITTSKDLFLTIKNLSLSFYTTAKFKRNFICSNCREDTAPGLTEININVIAYNFENIGNGTLIDYYPIRWELINANDGTVSSYNTTHNRMEWSISNINNSITKIYTLKSPERNDSLNKHYFSTTLSSGSATVKGDSSVRISPFRIKIRDSEEKEIDFDAEIDEIKSETDDGILLDIELRPKNKKITKIKFRDLKVKKNEEFNLSIEDAPKDIESPLGIKWEKVYSIDPTKLNFTDATVSSVATGTELYKCKDWNFTTQTCFGSWNKIMDLVPGQEYNFTLTAEDPGYAEAGLASINTNKSIYHPNEEAKIIMVVLDTAGHLVSNASVYLNITDPNNNLYEYSTKNNTINETEPGIYQAIFSATGSEGNYSMFVYATAENVNNSMLSYFIVKEYYEFDILRQTPVTIDPWQGPFNSSIKIVSYTNTGVFNFTEVLPINFTNITAKAAVQTITGNKILLTWFSLDNNSVVNYSAQAPLVTPELYELGQAQVFYEDKIFTEARTWYLAIDPITLTDEFLTPSSYSVPESSSIDVTGQYDTSGGGGTPLTWTIRLHDQNNNVDIDADCDEGGDVFQVTNVGWGIGCDGGAGESCAYVGDGSVTLVLQNTDNNQVVWTIEACSGASQYPPVNLITILVSGDGATLYATTGDITITSVNVPPTWSDNQTNDTAIYQGETINLSVRWNDDSGLDYYIFSTNLSSEWANDSEVVFTSTPQNATIVEYINQTPNNIVGWKMYANDSDGEWNETNNFTFKVLGVVWNDTSDLSLGIVEAGSVSDGYRNITAYGSNTNVDLACSGDCTEIQDNWTATSMTDEILMVRFNCSSTTAGDYYANFSLTSNEDTITENISINCTVQDTTAPTVRLESPANNSVWASSLLVAFKFNVSDYSDLANCSLIINNKLNKTNSSAVLKDTTGQTISETLYIGYFNWSVNCTDVYGNINSSGTYNVSVEQDIEAPTITIVNPKNGSYTNDEPVTLNITTTEAAKCKYNNSNSSFNYTTDGALFTVTDSAVHSVNLGTLAEGNYAYYIKCNDSSGNINNNSNQAYTNFTVDRTLPNVSINAPVNNSNSSKGYIILNWTAIDHYIDTNLTCNITIDGILNVSNIESENNTPTNYSIYLGNGTHTWNVTCSDNASNSNASKTFIINVDGDGPEISSASAEPPITGAGSTVAITATVADAIFSVSEVYVNVTLQTTGTIYYYKMNPIGNNQYRYTFTDTSVEDIYNYYIWANDTAAPHANNRTSSIYQFEIIGINAVIGIQTKNKTYKQDKIINITRTANYSSSYKGGNVTTTTLTGGPADRTCTQTFGYSCAATADDTFDSCWAGGADPDYDIHEVLVNVTSLLYTDIINVTCNVDCGGAGDNIYVWYRNSSTGTWREMLSTTCSVDGYITTTFNVDDVAGEHQARCIYDKDGNSDECSESGGTGANLNRYDNDDINFTVLLVDNDGTTDSINYTNLGTQNHTKLSDIDLNIEIKDYNKSASSSSNNNDPNLKVLLYDGGSFSYSYICNASGMTSFPTNCTKKIVNTTILEAWQDINNRKIQVKGIEIDYYEGIRDYINWTKIYVELLTPSKIENYGLINISARLLMKVEFYNNSIWNTVSVLYNQSINVSTNQTIDLSSFWNNHNFTSDTRPLGQYRAYTALTSSSGTVLQNEDGGYINDTYSFNISYLKIEVQSPVNGSTVDATNYWANITLDDTYYSSGEWCSFSLDGMPNVTMSNDTATHFFNFTNHTNESVHTITFYCNDTNGDISYETTTFNATDQTAPNISLKYPLDGADGLGTTITFRYNVSDVVSNIKNCSIWIDNKLKATNITITKDVSQNFTITGLGGGPHEWKIKCYDNSSNINLGTSPTWSFLVGTDISPPFIYLGDPQDDYETTNNDVVFQFGVYDEDSDIANCSLIFNGKVNKTKQTAEIVELTDPDSNSFTVNDMPIGLYNWSINCTDTASIPNTKASDVRNLSIDEDTDFPFIVLIYPSDGATLTSNDVGFQYNVTDASANIKNCSLYINGTYNTSGAYPPEDTINSLTVNDFDEGFYNWSINCTDDSYQANSNMSYIWNFTTTSMEDLKVSVGKDQNLYEQGTQANETIVITTNATDTYSNPIDGNVTTDVIFGNTTLKWWNGSWGRRKPIYLNDTQGQGKKNVSVWVNVTGLSGNVADCTNEMRVIENNSLSFVEIPSYVVRGDDSNYCEVVFNANITPNAINENNYYVYYSNPGASSPVYNLVLNQSAYQIGESGALTGTYANSYQTFPVTSANNNNYWAFGATDESSVNAYAQITFDLSNTNISEDRFTKLIFNITYCHSGEDSVPDCDGDDTIEGASGGNQDVEIFNYNTKTWTDIGDLNSNNNELEVNSSYSLTSNAPQYVNDTSREVRVRYELDWDPSGFQPNYWLVIDYAFIAVEYDAQVFKSGVGSEFKLINKSVNASGSDGRFSFNISSSGLDLGWYSVISFVEAAGYNNATNYTNFGIIKDNTDPTVNLVWPTDDYASPTNNITFIYNVSDALSGIKNCSLVINNTINWTNVSITEDARQNFTVNNFDNGNYIWTVNCTDDYNNTGTYTPENDLAIEYDITPPVINLVDPVNGWNDTNGNLTFIYNVSDYYNNVANCSLIINETINQTVYNVQEDTRLNFTVNDTDNGFYNWHINCSDSSSTANINSSERRNYTVIYDYAPPNITIVSPAEAAQSTTGNVSFIFNVADTISDVENCSLIINGTINQTNSSINEDVLQNFTVYNMSTGFYAWNITCTDNSENYNENTTAPLRNLTVAIDVVGPEINLEYPLAGAQFIDNYVVFRYNVSDLASEIANCSLIINNTINWTNISIEEDASQNFTVENFDEGFYNWSINCTDDATNPNTEHSKYRLLTIGIDETPPVITLEFPPNNNYNDTDGNVTFLYKVYDLASDITNCSILLDDVLNQTNISIIYEDKSNQNFTIGGMENGTHTWSINCTDIYGNQDNSTTWNFTVILDNSGPVITLLTPNNNTLDTDGDVLFYYNITDELSDILNCSLVINNKINITNITIVEGEKNNFTLSNLENSQYNWSVNCTDDSDNYNANSSETRNLTVLIDTGSPRINLISPPNNTRDSDGNRVFVYNVTDDISNISSCSLLFNGAVVQVNGTVEKDTNQNFSRTGMTNGQYNWSVSCTDASDNLNINTTGFRNLTVLLDSEAPDINLILPLNYTQDVGNNVTFTYNASDSYNITNCSLIINGTINMTNHSIIRNATMNFTFNNMPNGTFLWNINCTDDTEAHYQGESEKRILIVSPDFDAPIISLEAPENYVVDPDGIILFKYNASDFASVIKNCSLAINNTINTTNTSVEEGTSQNFTVSGLDNGYYVWQINCTDNSTNLNTGNSSVRYFKVGIDLTPPVVTITVPENNTRLTYQNVTFQYSVNDISSEIHNCSLIINGEVNQTNTTLLTEEAIESFTVNNIEQDTYNWSVNCTDNSISPNTGSSYVYNLTIKLKDIILVNVSTNASSYYKGDTAAITANITNNESEPLSTSVIIDIIRGNATGLWWDTSWHYRVPIEINTTNITRRDKLIEQNINFTDIIVNDLGISGKTFDNKSVRVVEWKENSSVEIISQFDENPNYDASNDATGDVIWIMNSTISFNKTKYYYIYFDTIDNEKEAAVYSMPTYSFRGNTQNVTFNGTNTSFDRMTISNYNNYLTLQFDAGDTLDNFDYIDRGGAGSISNITVNNVRITNPDSLIAPFVVRSNNSMQLNGTATVEPGHVITKITIPGNISTLANSKSELNYTIWFSDSEILVRADLYAYFGSNDENPASVRFNNEWFAYLLSNNSNWENYLYEASSQTQTRTHNYQNPNMAGFDQVFESAWYSEHGTIGSINVFAEFFKKNGVDKWRVVLFDDGYNTPPESDSVGFNYDETAIDAGSSYSVRVWMVFSTQADSTRAQDLEREFSSPINITQKKGEEWINRSSGNTDSKGMFNLNWSTVNQTAGWYSATAVANLTYYYKGSDYSLFEVATDIIAPIVTSGSLEGWLNYNNVTFKYYASENNLVINNCTLILNNRLNATNTTVANNEWNNFTLHYMPEAAYNWSVNCSDPSGNVGNSSTQIIYVDITKPNINLSWPNNPITLNYTFVEFNFTVTDNLDNNISCNLTIDDAVNATMNVSNGTMFNITIGNFSQQTHYWNVTCKDKADNTNTSATWSFTADIDSPEITLIRPVDPSNWGSNGNVTFIYALEELSDIRNCSLIIGGAINQTNQTAVNKSRNNNFTAYNMTEGQHTWSVNCTDELGHVGSSRIEVFYVDLTVPSIGLTWPPIGYVSSASSLQLNFTVTDNLNSSLQCNVTINGTVNNTDIINALNNTNVSYNVSGLGDGLFLWNATCWDIVNNTNTSETKNFIIAEPPSVVLGDPENKTRNADINYSFYFTSYDNSGSISNCSLIVNHKTNATNYSITEGSEFILNVTDFGHGAYNWTVNCTDPSGNTDTNESYKLIYVDLLGPNITQIKPTQGHTFSTNDIEFNFSATDQFGLLTIITCNMSLDGKVNISLINITSGSYNATTIYDIVDGRHNWSVTCKDDINNTNITGNVTFIVRAPDLAVNVSYIKFNNTNPKNNDTILINATIFNLGGAPAEDLNVSFYGIVPEGAIWISNESIALLDTGANKTVNATWNITFGLHQIRVSVGYDGTELSKDNNNATNNLSTLVPVIFSPANNTWTSNSTNIINFTIRDYQNNTLNYTVYVNGIFNRTANITDNLSSTLEVNLTEGAHYIILEAFGPRVDAEGLRNNLYRRINSTGLYIIIDQTNATPQFETGNETWFSDQTPEIRFNITDNLDSVLNYTLYINDVANLTNSTTNGTSTAVNLSAMNQDRYTLILEAFDEMNNTVNSSFIVIYVDVADPTVTLNSPQTWYNTSSTSIDFSFTAVDIMDVNLTCNITINGTIRDSNFEAENDTLTTRTIGSLNEGWQFWNVTCWDNATNSDTSDTWNFTVDLTDPTILLHQPENNSFNSSTDVTFYYTPSDYLVGIENCSLVIDNEMNQTNKTITEDIQNNFTVYDLEENKYEWTVNCTDHAGNIGTNGSKRTLYIDLTAPNASFITNNGTWFNNATPEIFFNITDNLDTILNYTIYVDNAIDIIFYVNNGTKISGNLSSLKNGTHNITIESFDNAYNKINSTNLTIIIDTVAPNITLYAPLNNSNVTKSEINFTFNVTDNLDTELLCNLTINDIVNISRFPANESANTPRLVTGFDTGYHNWSVTCEDNATNVFTSTIFYFNYTPPDLEVSTIDITFNTTTFEEDVNFTIFANITNIGASDAENVIVQFFEGDPDDVGVQISGNFTLNLTAGQNKTINLSWSFGIGITYIFVGIDRDNEIQELNEGNNKANTSISIGAYSIIFGNVTGNLVIESITNRTIFSWGVSNATSGNIFVIDSDSSVTWTNLTALGRNITGGNASNDWEELDTALNSTNLTDSINTTHLSNYVPLNITSFVVFTNIIGNVSIVNSTNSTNFVTGILWDQSDDRGGISGGGQYNGSEDVVFITEIQRNQQGMYGNYDFEIKVPAMLREYIKPNNQNSVTFYVELK